MRHLMLCDHKRTKMKLISWATDSRIGHQQGFKMSMCCARCGRIVRGTNPVSIGRKSV